MNVELYGPAYMASVSTVCATYDETKWESMKRFQKDFPRCKLAVAKVYAAQVCARKRTDPIPEAA